MPTYRLDLAYDGAPFAGYAIQNDVVTVQGELERALRPHTGAIQTAVAGRTDRGVHATEQVVSFTSREIDTEYVRRSLNKQLGPHIAVHRISEVADDFHARFSATGRAYRYRVLQGAVHDPLRASSTWYVPDSLDIGLMNRTAALVVGEHDFSALCRRYRDRSLVRFVEWARWNDADDEMHFSIGAKAFCHQLVRSVVGLCTDVGRGRITFDEAASVLESRDRSHGRQVAPPHALTLVAVSYGDDELPRPAWAEEPDDYTMTS